MARPDLSSGAWSARPPSQPSGSCSLWLVPGLFAQAGIAEEVLFRGYLFRHAREGRDFWRAALVAAGLFVTVHLLMFLMLPWPIALASLW